MSLRAVLFAIALPLALQAMPCERLLTVALPHVTIATAEARPASAFTPPRGKPIHGLPAFCRVAGTIAPSPDSDIRFEVWLPATGWNGKFRGIGNGGYAGAISFDGLAETLGHGYATASTDTGHQGSVDVSAQWALHHPEKITDFGYRAIHETAVAAKLLIAAFYGKPPERSYFSSCSNGGRQALMEAQRYPDDYDGIVAGAPANDWTHLLSLAASNAKATLAVASSYFPAAKLPAIEAAALAQCDANDGVRDGVIENPMTCHFDPTVLLCMSSKAPTMCASGCGASPATAVSTRPGGVSCVPNTTCRTSRNQPPNAPPPTRF